MAQNFTASELAGGELALAELALQPQTAMWLVSGAASAQWGAANLQTAAWATAGGASTQWGSNYLQLPVWVARGQSSIQFGGSGNTAARWLADGASSAQWGAANRQTAGWAAAGSASTQLSSAEQQAAPWNVASAASAQWGAANLQTAAWAVAGGASVQWGSATANDLSYATLLSQYANSPTIVQLVRDMAAYVDPRIDLAAFFDMVWNVDTAQGWGLDIWGRIVGVSRSIQYANPAPPDWLGFRGGVGFPLSQAPFRHGTDGLKQTLTLADDAYRTLIMVKAMANISACSAPSLNQLLQNLFAGRGRCYVQDIGQMQMSYIFEFDLQPWELAIVTSSGVFPHPAAVGMTIVNVAPASTFGFKGTGLQPFGSGAFFSTNQVHHATA